MFKKAKLEIYEIDIEDIIMTSNGDFTGDEVDPFAD